MGKILFFGYGANRNRRKIAQIIGRDPGEGVGGILEGYVLGYQGLDETPNPPREFLKDIYGYDFKAYTIRKGKGLVLGVIWEIEEEDLIKIKDWEFVGVWRKLDNLPVKSAGGKLVKVVTEFASQGDIKVVDGIIYDEFINIKHTRRYFNPLQEEYYTKRQIDLIKNWLKGQYRSS